jgi:hypothetical protein
MWEVPFPAIVRAEWESLADKGDEPVFVTHPIKDFGTPPDDTARELVRQILALVSERKVVSINCFGGQGRTGMVTALLLGAVYRLPAAHALSLTQRAYDTRKLRSRGTSPDSASQMTLVRRLLAPNESGATAPVWW